jgi:uncharacterized protein (UPF0335 family)
MMQEVLHANIFFVIASIATVVFCILVCIALYHVIKIVRIIRRLLERIEAGSQTLADDLSEIRDTIAASGGFITRVLGFVVGQQTGRKRRRKRADYEE